MKNKDQLNRNHIANPIQKDMITISKLSGFPLVNMLQKKILMKVITSLTQAKLTKQLTYILKIK